MSVKLMHLLVAGLTLCLTLPALAGGKHEHGAGRLDLAIDKATITLDLELPLDVLLGFERPPRTAKEREALDAAIGKLRAGSALFQPTPAAACSLRQAEVTDPFGTADAKAGAGDHADAGARFVFVCAQPAALTAIETSVFKSFPRLYRLELQRVGPSGQGGGRLSPKSSVIRW